MSKQQCSQPFCFYKLAKFRDIHQFKEYVDKFLHTYNMNQIIVTSYLEDHLKEIKKKKKKKKNSKKEQEECLDHV